MKENVVKILLKNNKKAIVDVDDYPRVSKFKWWLFKEGYVATAIGSKKLGTRKNLPLSHLILNIVSGPKKDVFYVDGNPLNNRKTNLVLKDSRTKLIGKRFGRLLITAFHHYDGKARTFFWECLCDCGNKTVVSTSGLQRKKRPSISCGCWRYERITGKPASNRLLKSKANLNALFWSYKKSAQKRGIVFLLSKEEFAKLTKDFCYYCGVKPSQKFCKRETFGEYLYNGIDRLDSSKSYILTNCVSCCKTCNYAKRVMSTVEFRLWVSRVFNYFVKNNP